MTTPKRESSTQAKSSGGSRSLTKDRRRLLLEGLAEIVVDSDISQEAIVKVFLPLPEHRRVLADRVVLVLGDRGVGKSALFHFMQTPQGRQELTAASAQDNLDRRWIVGFAETSMEHPSPEAVLRLADGGDAMLAEGKARAFWLGHLIGRISTAGGLSLDAPPLLNAWREAPNDPQHWLEAVGDPTRLMLWLDRLETELAAQQRVLVITYDHLDKIGVRRRDIRRRVLPPLLALWLSFSNRYRHIRAKIFLRRDLFDEAVAHTADVTKLMARSETLRWSLAALYRLLIRHMAGNQELRGWLQEGKYKIGLMEDPELGWMPPPELSEEAQERLITHIVGPLMGERKNVRTGYSWRWVPARLQDAHGVIAPRSMLTLFQGAARLALQSQESAGKYVYLLAPKELKDGLRNVSERRVSELVEEHPVVGRLDKLSDTSLPAAVDVVIQALSSPVDEDDGFGSSGEKALDELVRLGVCARLPKRQIDVADIYRLKFKIDRRGQKITTAR